MTETIQAIADRLEITVEGESSNDEKESLKEEFELNQQQTSLPAQKPTQVSGEGGGSSAGSSDEDGDMREDLPKEEYFKEDEGAEMKTVDFIKEARVKKQEALQSSQKRRLTKNEQATKAKGKFISDKVGYTKPDYGLDREKERKLLHAATKGVVQLFNAVSDRQKFLDKKLEELNAGNRIQRRQTMEEIKSYNFREKLKKVGTDTKRVKLAREEELKQEGDSSNLSSDCEEDRDQDKDDADLCDFSSDQGSDDDELKEETESIDESF